MSQCYKFKNRSRLNLQNIASSQYKKRATHKCFHVCEIMDVCKIRSRRYSMFKTQAIGNASFQVTRKLLSPTILKIKRNQELLKREENIFIIHLLGIMTNKTM